MKKHLAVAALAFLIVAPSAQAAKNENLGKAGGFTYVRGTANVEGVASASKDVSARCPADQVAVNGGGSISGSPGDAYLSTSGHEEFDEWLTVGWHLTSEKAKLQGYAVCTKRLDQYVDDANAYLAVAGPVVVSGTADCLDGSVVGGGVRPGGAPTDWEINSTFPLDGSADGDMTPDDEWRSLVEHRAGTSDSTMFADATCLTGPVPEYVTKDKVSSETSKAVTAKCPKGSVAVGGGASAGGTVFDAHLVRSTPYDSKDKGKVPEDGWTVTYSNDAAPTGLSVQAIAVCR